MAWQPWMQDPDDLYDGAHEEFVGDQIMCLIDARAPMVNSHMAEGHGSHMANSLKLIMEIMKFKIVHGDNSSIGVLFFGTKKVPEHPHRRSHWVEFIKLSVPSAENIHKLQDFIDKIHVRFDEEVGYQDPASKASHINEVLWKCNDEFQRCAPKGKKDREYQTRIWIFTNNDTPEDGNKDEQSRIVDTAKRFFQTNILISLWYIDTDYSQESFKLERFFHKVLITNPDENDGEDFSSRAVRASLRGFDQATRKVREHFYQKRQLYFGVMDIGCGGVEMLIGVQFFSQYKIAKKPIAQKIDAETHEILMSSSDMITETSGRTLDKEEVQNSVKQFLSIGDGQLEFSRAYIDELVEKESRAPVRHEGGRASATGGGPNATKPAAAASSSKSAISLIDDDDDDAGHGMAETKEGQPARPQDDVFENALPTPTAARPSQQKSERSGNGNEKEMETFTSISVLYYTTLSKLKPELALSEPLFVVPHDMSMRGSSTVFATLHSVMLQRGLIAIVKYRGPDRARKYPSRLAALLPQKQSVDGSGAVTEAAGFNLLKLPFKGDLRANPMPVAPNLLHGLTTTSTPDGTSAVTAAEQMIQSLLLDTSDGYEGVDSQESSQFTEESQEHADEPEATVASMAASQSNKPGAGRYNYLDVEGPARQHFYSILEGVALKYKATDGRGWTQADDRMVPDLRMFGKQLQTRSVEAFQAAVHLPDNAISLVEDKKRKSVYEPTSKAKVVKVAEMDAATLNTLKASDLSDFTVPALKIHCKALGLPVGGNKNEVIERIVTKIATM